MGMWPSSRRGDAEAFLDGPQLTVNSPSTSSRSGRRGRPYLSRWQKVSASLLAALLCSTSHPFGTAGAIPITEWTSQQPPPGPVAVRSRMSKYRNSQTKVPELRPAEAEFALDMFQRAFPQNPTEEGLLIRRWEMIAGLFGSGEAANQLVEGEPAILREEMRKIQTCVHYVKLKMGEEAAMEMFMTCPYLLTKRGNTLRETIDALLNVLGSKDRLKDLLMKYPGLAHVPTGHFYGGLGDVIAVAGSPEAAYEVTKEARERVVKSPYGCLVPQCYPALVAILGGIEQAHAALDREPTIMRHYAKNMFPMVLRLRELLGKDLAQKVMNEAPYLLIAEDKVKHGHEEAINVRQVQVGFRTLNHYFGREEALRMVEERPELMTLGHSLRTVARYAERKLGSKEAVRDNFEGVLRRTGLMDHLKYKKAPRPRQGYWSYAKKHQIKKRIFAPWTAASNKLGRDTPIIGQWNPHPMDDEAYEDEDEDEDGVADSALQEEVTKDDRSDGTLPFSIPTFEKQE